MKQIIRTIFCLLALTCVSVCRAEVERVEHNFNSDYGKTFIASNSNKTGETDLLTYTCSGSAVFGLDHVYGNTISLRMPGYSSVVTSPVVGLKEIQLYFYPSDKKRESIKLYLSTDGGSTWGSALTDGVTYSPGSIVAILPIGTYSIKIENTASSATSFYDIRYYVDACDNCVTYVEE